MFGDHTDTSGTCFLKLGAVVCACVRLCKGRLVAICSEMEHLHDRYMVAQLSLSTFGDACDEAESREQHVCVEDSKQDLPSRGHGSPAVHIAGCATEARRCWCGETPHTPAESVKHIGCGLGHRERLHVFGHALLRLFYTSDDAAE